MALQQFLIFLPAAFLLGVSPGANNLLAFIAATKAGWLRTARSVIGRLAAWAVLVVLVSLGLDVLLRTSELAFVVLKWVGVAYLTYLAWQFWKADVTAEIEAPDVSTLMKREFLTLMGNPKAYLLLTAFLPQFLNDAAPIMPQLFMLGGAYMAIEGLAALLWVTAGTLIGAHALTPLRRRIINRTSAGLMGTAAFFSRSIGEGGIAPEAVTLFGAQSRLRPDSRHRAVQKRAPHAPRARVMAGLDPAIHLNCYTGNARAG